MSKEEWSNQLVGESRYLLSLVELGGRGEGECTAVGLAAASDSAVTEVPSSCRLMLKMSWPPGVGPGLAVVVEPRSAATEGLSASSLDDPAHMSRYGHYYSAMLATLLSNITIYHDLDPSETIYS